MPDQSELLIEVQETNIALSILEKINADQLLRLAREFCGQVVVQGDAQYFAEALLPFVDWVIRDVKQLDQKIWQQAQRSVTFRPVGLGAKRALFLDRDGVINIDHGYVGDPQKVQLQPGIGQLIHRANRKGLLVSVVTNQSGIGRGLYSEEDFERVMKCIHFLIQDDYAQIDHVEWAPYHPQSATKNYRLGRHLRKPRPGMILQAAMQLDIDRKNSFLVGDRATDLRAGVLAGVGHIYLLDSEQSDDEFREFKNWASLLKDQHGFKTLLDGIEVRRISRFEEISEF